MAPRHHLLPVVPQFLSSVRCRPSSWCVAVMGVASLACLCVPRPGDAAIRRPPNTLPVVDPGDGFGVPNEPDAPAKRGMLVPFSVHVVPGPVGVWFAPQHGSPLQIVRTLKARRTWR